MRSRQAIGRMEVAADTNSMAAMKAPAKAVAAWRLELNVADIGNPLFEPLGPDHRACHVQCMGRANWKNHLYYSGDNIGLREMCGADRYRLGKIPNRVSSMWCFHRRGAGPAPPCSWSPRRPGTGSRARLRSAGRAAPSACPCRTRESFRAAVRRMGSTASR